MPRPLAALLVLGIALAGCGGGGSEKPAGSPPPAATARTGGCQKVSAPAPRDVAKLAKPHTRLAAGRKYVATVVTSCGSFQITLDPRRAPSTGGSFLYLVRHRFYDGLTFHRISVGFVIQGGDPLGDGTGGPGYTVVEHPPASLDYSRGVVAMAKAQTDPAGASGSQFFIVTGQDAQLPPDYALLGRVTSGQDVVDRIGQLGDSSERPTQTVLIRSIRIAVSG